MTRPEITDEMVERLARFLQSEWAGPCYASVFMPEERTYYSMDNPESEARRMARQALERALWGHDR